MRFTGLSLKKTTKIRQKSCRTERFVPTPCAGVARDGTHLCAERLPDGQHEAFGERNTSIRFTAQTERKKDRKPPAGRDVLTDRQQQLSELQTPSRPTARAAGAHCACQAGERRTGEGNLKRDFYWEKKRPTQQYRGLSPSGLPATETNIRTKQKMIESGITTSMSGLHENSGQSHHTTAQEYRLLTTDLSQLKDELPGDLQSLSWLTSVDVPRLQQIGGRRAEFSSAAQNSLLEQQSVQLNNMTVAGGAAMHLQGDMQHSPLAINSMPQFSPGFPCAASMYQTAPQQVLTFTQANQQCSTGGLYGNYNSQSLYPQGRINAHTQDLQPKTFPKPIYSYSCLIAMALKNSKTGSLPVSEIYSFMKEHFPYFKTAPDGWKNSVRHNLSLNKCFEKVENKMSGSSRKGCLWALNPAKIDKMEEEMQKWKRKDLPAIRRSMANPDELDKLITDRPESCRQKSVDSGMTRLPSCPAGPTLPVPAQLQPQQVLTLSLQCLPMHQHLQLQLQNQSRLAPASPAPAQTPPLHTLPDLMNSSLPQHPAKQPTDFYTIHTDAHSEVDALDPSIMDFSWQGNLWEDMKDDSFNLEALGTVSNSPLRLSDCDLDTGSGTPVSSAEGLHYPDLQVTGLYSSYSAVDVLSNQYINTQGGTKPIVLL